MSQVTAKHSKDHTIFTIDESKPDGIANVHRTRLISDNPTFCLPEMPEEEPADYCGSFLFWLLDRKQWVAFNHTMFEEKSYGPLEHDISGPYLIADQPPLTADERQKLETNEVVSRTTIPYIDGKLPTKQKFWLSRFKQNAQKMHQEKVPRFDYQFIRGYIESHLEEKCLLCGSTHVYFGEELECGHLYEVATAIYCPACDGIKVISTQVNFAPYQQARFLPIMKQKLLGIESGASDAQICPLCSKKCQTFQKDLGGIDYYNNRWVVCTGLDCDWPGSHHEDCEQGPY